MRSLLTPLCAVVLALPLPAVDLNLTAANGSKARLKDLRGHIVVLNFWATWCGPCKSELPLLAAAEAEYRDRGVVFIAASVDEPKDRRRALAMPEELGVHFPVWTGATGDDMERFRAGQAVPATVFLDKEGRIAARVSGLIRPEEIRQRLDWLLNGQPAPGPAPFVSHLETPHAK